ncbi:MAG: hypothetical protein RLZZ484_855, partial [Pseudomonadota bacterium]
MAATTSRSPITALRSAWRWALAGVLLGSLLSLALNLPAAWLSSAVSRATQGRRLLLEA